ITKMISTASFTSPRVVSAPLTTAARPGPNVYGACFRDGRGRGRRLGHLGGGERLHTLGAAVPTELRPGAVRARAPVSRCRARGWARQVLPATSARPRPALSRGHPAGRD